MAPEDTPSPFAVDASSARSLLGSAVWETLPESVRACVAEPRWWDDETRAPNVMAGLGELTLPSLCDDYRRLAGAVAQRWSWRGHVLIHNTSAIHSGVTFFGPVLVGPDCEIGPHATIYGPTVIVAGSYLGPSVEIRRCLIQQEAEIAHMSYVGHSVIGRGARLGAFFCSAVRNLDGSMVRVLRGHELMETAETTLGCVLADGTQTGVHTTIMPGRRVVRTPAVLPNSVVIRNC